MLMKWDIDNTRLQAILVGIVKVLITIVITAASSWAIYITSTVNTLRDRDEIIQENLQLLNRKVDILLFQIGAKDVPQPKPLIKQK